MSDDTDHTMIKDTHIRVRRLETRLTSYMEAKGFSTQLKKPVWSDEGEIILPNLASSLKMILAVIPEGHKEDIVVKCDGKEIIVFDMAE